MNVSITEKGEVQVVEIEGSIDSKTAADLQQSVMDVVSKASHVILDLSKVSFVSSAGLRVLLMVYRQLKTKDGKVLLVGVSEEIKEIMFMTGFNNFFEIYQTVDEGLRKI
jgi:anti-sigma B factor antagonist